MLAGLAGTAPSPAPSPPVVPGSYPVRLDGPLDPRMSRWLWLVKWFLAIPHSVVLGLLWLAVLPLTVVAGFAILFTGRYPRAIFEFNVGVMRWTWRVSYYTFNALGTDRYPPFSLDSDPDVPGRPVVDYPARLSRGLVLVKWWLLALPHLPRGRLLAGGWAGPSDRTTVVVRRCPAAASSASWSWWRGDRARGHRHATRGRCSTS